jgi:4-hydroxybenzoate polyprenyltransferase
MAGFYFVSLNQKLDAFPKKIFWLLFFIYLLVSNVKDIKDIEGDRADKIKTIPVVFGEKNGKKIIGFLVGFSTLFVPLTLQDKFLSFLGLFFAILFYYLINRKKYQESIIFLFYFFYAILIILRI